MEPLPKITAIFVGASFHASRPFEIRYGHTGTCLRPNRARNVAFTHDGMNLTFFIPRKLIYVPSTDKTRHCPKP